MTFFKRYENVSLTEFHNLLTLYQRKESMIKKKKKKSVQMILGSVSLCNFTEIYTCNYLIKIIENYLKIKQY